MDTPKSPTLAIRQLKRPDLVAQEIKRLITEKNLSPGDRLPRESELQAQFQVSKGTIREALKSLEVQGLITIPTGPSGGGTVVEVPLDRTLQFMQNYLFFQEVTIDDIYTVRQMLEPELAAGAVPHLTEADFDALEHSIACCDPTQSSEDLVSQRREDVNFHDILAAANPNPFLRFTCELINEMIRQLIVFANRTPQSEHRRFGEANARIHRDIVQAARERDAVKVHALMQQHMRDAASSVKRMKGRIQGRLILDADSLRSPRPQRAVQPVEKPAMAVPRTAPKKAPKPAAKAAPTTTARPAAKTAAKAVAKTTAKAAPKAPAKSPSARPAAARKRAAS